MIFLQERQGVQQPQTPLIQSSIELNKIAAAALLASLTATLVGFVANI